MASAQNSNVNIDKFRSKYAFKKKLLFAEKYPLAFAGPILQAIDQFKDKLIRSELDLYYNKGFTHVIIYLKENVQK